MSRARIEVPQLENMVGAGNLPDMLLFCTLNDTSLFTLNEAVVA